MTTNKMTKLLFQNNIYTGKLQKFPISCLLKNYLLKKLAYTRVKFIILVTVELSIYMYVYIYS